MTGYTVILLYPDHATGDYGADIYVEYSPKADPYEAAEDVRRMAAEANGDNERGAIPADDFRPIAVIEGDHVLALDATSF